MRLALAARSISWQERQALSKARTQPACPCPEFRDKLQLQTAVAQKKRYQNGTLVSGNMDQNLRHPSCLILSHTQTAVGRHCAGLTLTPCALDALPCSTAIVASFQCAFQAAPVGMFNEALLYICLKSLLRSQVISQEVGI
ncbi:unnamed protein product [Effrenium voratum]|uniref:Uncharacterized protein n=1 Tax=Effrenium voratum TaxID=2562239 RepID=A0AA36IEQ1_9DINO|nr:unnamed protein product [Effrenium voratum]CAJ1449254.1 unnamed protein product [Effrenium voratum]